MNRQFDVGDRVLVLPEKVLKNRYTEDKDGDLRVIDDLYITPKMLEFCGKVVTIRKIIKYDGFYYNGFEIEEDGGEHLWTHLFFDKFYFY